MLHTIRKLTNAALDIVRDVWLDAFTQTPLNSQPEKIVRGYAEEAAAEDYDRYMRSIIEDDPWAGKCETTLEEARMAQLKELDEDPRFQDGFARPDWDGDPNEY